jgi:hypothetical protein
MPLNEGLRQQHGTFEDGTPRYQFRFVESEEITASAANYFGVAVITVNTPLRDLLWALSERLSNDPRIAKRFGITTTTQQQMLHLEIFNTVIGIVVAHEYGHHILDHCVQHSPDIPLYSDIVNGYGGNIEHQAREIQADGYAVYLVLYGLLLGARQNSVAESISGISNEGRLCLFIISAATFFFIREAARLDPARIEELTHPPAAFRLNALMHHVQRYLSESKPELLAVLTLPFFQELLRTVKQVLWEGDGPAWPEQDQFGHSPAGDAYIKKLYGAYDALQNRHRQESGSGESVS